MVPLPIHPSSPKTIKAKQVLILLLKQSLMLHRNVRNDISIEVRRTNDVHLETQTIHPDYPDILIWPSGMSRWIHPSQDTPANIYPPVSNRRTHVISSIEEDSEDHGGRMILEERLQNNIQGLAQVNVFYYLLAEDDDLQIYINKRTGHVSSKSSIAENDDDYEILRNLTQSISVFSQRWWIMNIENIACKQCVEEVRHNKREV